MTNPLAAYRGRRVLVTGATGFIGRWVARALTAAGAELWLIARRPGSMPEDREAYQIRGASISADLALPGSFTRTYLEVNPDITFNLAGYGVDPEERDPATAEALNFQLVVEIAEAIAANPETDWPGLRLVHVGTAAEYGHSPGALTETSPVLAESLYGRTKLQGSLALAAVCQRAGLRAMTARLFTVYGPGERAGRLLPSLLSAAQSGAPLPLTTGTQQRDFTYVGEVAEGLVRLGAVLGPVPHVVNLATGRLTSVREFIECAAGLLGLKPLQLQFGALPQRDNELQQGPVDTSCLRALLRWVPECPIHEGIRRTIAFEGRLSGVRN